MSESTVTVESWVWIGGASTDFSNYNNWNYGPLFHPTVVAPADLPAIIGAVTSIVNGQFSEFIVPQSMPVLTSDFTSPLTRLYAGMDTALTVQGATYTTSVQLGDYIDHQAQGTGVPADQYTRDLGTAVLNLQGGTIAGSVTVGTDERGILSVSGNSTVTSLLVAQSAGSVGTVNIAAAGTLGVAAGITYGAGNGTINNYGAVVLAASIRDSSGDAVFHNLSGGTVELSGFNGFSLIDGAGAAQLINDAGASVLKTGADFAYISWDFINNGSVNVQGGQLYVQADYAGNGALSIAAGAGATIDGSLLADSTLAMSGDGLFGFSLNGGYKLALSGDYTVGNASTLMDGTIENSGNAVLAASIRDSSGDAVFHNLSGGTVELSGFNGFSLIDGTGAEQLINDAGASVLKTGADFAYISWDFINNGSVNVQGGQLYVQADYAGNGALNIAAGAGATIDGSLLADSTLAMSGDGLFGFRLNGGYKLALSGDYTIGNASTLMDGTIENSGNAVLAASIRDSSGDAVFHNLSGGTVELSGFNGFSLIDGTGAEQLINDAGASVLKTGADAASIGWNFTNYGTVDVQAGQLNIYGGYSGSGTVNIATGASVLITGTQLSDEITTTGNGSATVSGEGGDDTVQGGAGGDRLDGGANGVLGDTLSYAGSIAGVSVNLQSGVASGGHAQGDTISNFENLTGSVHADTLVGNAQDNTLKGGTGNDTLAGGDGADTLNGGDGNDLLFGGTGADQLIGGAGDDKLYVVGNDSLLRGDAGHDQVIVLDTGGVNITIGSGVENVSGNSGNDVINAGGTTTAIIIGGGGGVDTLTGGSAADTLAGGDGNDILIGNNGDDVFFGGAGADSFYAGAGDDKIYVIGNDAAILGGAGFDQAIVLDAAGVNITLGAGMESASGSSGNDTISASGLTTEVSIGGAGGVDILTGGSANDTLAGGIGNDVLFGGAGNDTIFGGDGNDGFFGGAGNDQMIGGAGVDTFYFLNGSGNDFIQQFENGVDTFNFANHSQVNSMANLTITDAGADAYVSFNGGGQFIAFGAAGLIETSDFVFA